MIRPPSRVVLRGQVTASCHRAYNVESCCMRLLRHTHAFRASLSSQLFRCRKVAFMAFCRRCHAAGVAPCGMGAFFPPDPLAAGARKADTTLPLHPCPATSRTMHIQAWHEAIVRHAPRHAAANAPRPRNGQPCHPVESFDRQVYAHRGGGAIDAEGRHGFTRSTASARR